MTPPPARWSIAWVGPVAALVAAAGAEPWLVGVWADDAVYLGMAESLAAGRGLVVDVLPGAPEVAKYPLGYPAVLAALAPLTGGVGTGAHLGAALAVNVVAWALAVQWTVGALVPRLGGDRAAQLATGFALAVSTVAGRLVPQLLSEALFALLLVLLVERALAAAAEARAGTLAAVAGLGMALAAVRSVGAPLLLVGVAVAALARRPRLALALGLGWAGQAALSAAQRATVTLPEGDAARVLHYFTSYDEHVGYYTGALADGGPARLLGRLGAVLARNLDVGPRALGEFVAPLSFAGGPTGEATGAGMWWVGAALLGLALVAAATRRARWGVGVILVAWVAVFLAWTWPFSVRFWLPVVPLIFALAVVGLGEWGAVGRALRWGLAAGVLLFNAPDPWYRARGLLAREGAGGPHPAAVAEGGVAAPSDRGFLAAVRAVDERAGPEDVVVGDLSALWLAERAGSHGIDLRSLLPADRLLELTIGVSPDGAPPDAATLAAELAPSLDALGRLLPEGGDTWIVVDPADPSPLTEAVRLLVRSGRLERVPAEGVRVVLRDRGPAPP